ncbi:hypothetical protein HBI82_033720 [Parastagonospora nodorum]|nr:hypothetical protein HBI82_033720 [Parastagonospora nodorum]
MPPKIRLKTSEEMQAQSLAPPAELSRKRPANNPAVSDMSKKQQRMSKEFSIDTSDTGRKLTEKFKEVGKNMGELQDEQGKIVGILEHNSKQLNDVEEKVEKISSQNDEREREFKDELGKRPTSAAINITFEKLKVEQRQFHGEQKQDNENWKNEQLQSKAAEKDKLDLEQQQQNEAIQQVRNECGEWANKQQQQNEAIHNNQRLQGKNVVALDVRHHELELEFRNAELRNTTLNQIVVQNRNDTEQLRKDMEARSVTTTAAMEEIKRDIAAQIEQRAQANYETALAKLREDFSTTQASLDMQIETLSSHLEAMAEKDKEVNRLSEALKVTNKGLEKQIQANTELQNRVETLEASAKNANTFIELAREQIEPAQRKIADLQEKQADCATKTELGEAKDRISGVVDAMKSHATKEDLDDFGTAIVKALQTHLHKIDQTCYNRTQGTKELFKSQKFVAKIIPTHNVPPLQTKLLIMPAPEGPDEFNFNIFPSPRPGSRMTPNGTRPYPSPPAAKPQDMYPSPSTPTVTPQALPRANPQAPPRHLGPPQYGAEHYANNTHGPYMQQQHQQHQQRQQQRQQRQQKRQQRQQQQQQQQQQQGHQQGHQQGQHQGQHQQQGQHQPQGQAPERRVSWVSSGPRHPFELEGDAQAGVVDLTR